jgi:hypothetical protein
MLTTLNNLFKKTVKEGRDRRREQRSEGRK